MSLDLSELFRIDDLTLLVGILSSLGFKMACSDFSSSFWLVLLILLLDSSFPKPFNM